MTRRELIALVGSTAAWPIATGRRSGCRTPNQKGFNEPIA
jgi:hypothetical protein